MPVCFLRTPVTLASHCLLYPGAAEVGTSDVGMPVMPLPPRLGPSAGIELPKSSCLLALIMVFLTRLAPKTPPADINPATLLCGGYRLSPCRRCLVAVGRGCCGSCAGLTAAAAAAS